MSESAAPALADLRRGVEIYNANAGKAVSVHTFKHYPIRYKIVGRSRIYEVDDIIAYARKRVADAPWVTPTPRLSGKK
jgi:hypothetical protein